MSVLLKVKTKKWENINFVFRSDFKLKRLCKFGIAVYMIK